MREMLELLRIQRHDFMNHLQVISGLLQLKKYERALEYVRQVGEELGQAGVIARLGCPEIACAILTGSMEAQKCGITVSQSLETGLEKGVLSELALAEIIREILRMAVNASGAGGSVDLRVSERGANYVFRVSFTGKYRNDDLAQTANRIFLEEAAAKLKARFSVRNQRNGTAVASLTVPARKTVPAGKKVPARQVPAANKLPAAAESGEKYEIKQTDR